MPDAYWLTCRMQTTITLLVGPHYLIWHLSGKSHHIQFQSVPRLSELQPSLRKLGYVTYCLFFII